jgi:hypothetical protein
MAKKPIFSKDPDAKADKTDIQKAIMKGKAMAGKGSSAKPCKPCTNKK